MTKKEEALKKLAELKLELNKTEEIIKKYEAMEIAWIPKLHEFYCVIDFDEEVKIKTWFNDAIDLHNWNFGNIYSSKQEAENARDARIIMTDLQRMADEANGEKIRANNADAGLFYIVYRQKSILSDAFVTIMCDSEGFFVGLTYGIGFKVKESAQQALDTLISKHGKDKVKMALSGVWR